MDKAYNMSVNKLATLIGEFYSNDDFKQPMLKILREICRTTEVDRMSITIRNDDLDKYLTLYEYSKEDGFTDFGANIGLEVKHCINTLFNDDRINEKYFRELLNENNYIYTKNYQEVKNAMRNVGFISPNEDKIQEIYVYLAGCSSLFAYCTFEKYSGQNLSDEQINVITTICKIVNSKMEHMVEIREVANELLMKNAILENEKVPIALADKDTCRVLYFNDLYKKAKPSIKLNEVCDELLSAKDEFKKAENTDCFLIDCPNETSSQWIKKAMNFKLANDKDAYIVYSKNSLDYINQINAVDKLTQALLFRGFDEYYKNFVQRSNDKYALCSLDIDKFKYINNVFGYDVGDEVLKKVSNVIDKFIENEENFCRIGEDKFSIFLRYEDEVELHFKIRELARLFEKMRNVHFKDARITIIGGITLVDKELSLNELLDQATIARKSAKGSHKNKFSYYDPELDLKVKKELQIEEQIPHAIANKEFVAFLQPKFDLKTKKICGAEALVRWITPKGMIFPDQFIPLFEKNGFIVTLDFIIYEQVMEYLRKCIDNNFPVYPISVNVSRNHIKSKHFIGKFMDLVNKYDIPHEYLELEVTESVFVEDKLELKNFIDEIKAQDLKVSIDDFGTAYSSLQTLTDINVDILKIDKGFLDNINMADKDVITKDEILIKNIINLAKELEFKVICEGVETDEQIELLKNIGCELGQGYVFAKPMSISDYEEKFICVSE